MAIASLLVLAGTAIAPADSITLTSPNGGEEWLAGTVQTITWDGVDLAGDVQAYLYENGQYIAYLGSAPASSGFLEWLVCSFVGNGSDYSVTVYGQNFLEYDTSDATFSISGAEPRPQLFLTSPSGGEYLTAGATTTITWTSTDPQGTVNIELYKGGQWYNYLGQAPMADGYFDWNICQGLEDASDWSIQLTWSDCAYVSAGSGTFETTGGTPQPPPIVTLTSPNDGEVLVAGSQATITWESINPSGGVSIQLYNGSGWSASLGYVDMSANAFVWDICTGFENRNDYYISIDGSDACGAYAGDRSDGQFAITGATPEPVPTISLTGPSGGASWAIGTTQSITWNSTNPNGVAYFMLYQNGAHVGYINSAPMADGTLAWYVCSFSGPGSGYTIGVYGYDRCGRYVGTTFSQPFTIEPGTSGTIQLTSPNGGETWQAGSTTTITWTTPNPTGSVNVWLLKGGLQHSYLGSALASTGLLEYQVCDYLPAASDYRVRVEQFTSCGTIPDTSDGNFSVAGPLVSVTVVSPNGGETFTAGSTIPISWSTANAPPGAYVQIHVVKNSVSQFLAYVPANSSPYHWQTCSQIGDGSDYAIEILMYGCATTSDRSNGFFSITGSDPSPVLTVTSPSGGEILEAGSDVYITWEAANLFGGVQISLIRGTGMPVPLAWVDVSDGSFYWHICEYQGDAENYRIQLEATDLCGRVVSDLSDMDSTIIGSFPRPTFSVTSPSAGQSYAIGGDITVTWDTADPSGYVDVYLERPGGSSYWIGQVPMYDGSLTALIDYWVEPATDYVVRLAWCGCDPCIDSLSAGSFTIFTPSPADFDRNGYVNTADYDLFKPCSTGSRIPYAPPIGVPGGCLLATDGDGFIAADLDRDGDVDQSDFGLFQACVSGANLADPGCVDW